ncbi:TPA: hypothetical protein PXO92_002925 [Yersinia enterocolitica]|nr:hypothetical protein [Yersinia enterocolitica]
MKKTDAEELRIEAWKQHRKAVAYFEQKGQFFCEKFGVSPQEVSDKKKPHH